ncbi:hypothetical protein PJ912_17485 [Pectobacterium colocasium]|uniref:hypothetical protein n=1 Tax=Pectobacterium TaxID=122277 RepID=UPI003D74E855|nr:hypothetical protein KXZ65_16435 [Pectobacterium sp. PL152]
MHKNINTLLQRSIAASAFLFLTFTADNAFAVDVKGKFTKGGVDFTYAEQKYGSGAGNRGIRIMAATRDQTYKFSPNPHDDPWYNKNQEKFYRTAAEALADSYLASPQKIFPRYGFKSTINKIEYTYGER